MQSSVILRTGEEMPAQLVSVVMLSLKTLIQQNPIAFYELVEISRDPKHQLFGNTGDILRNLRLIETDGQPHDATRWIVLAATEGEGLKLNLVSPIRKEQEEKQRASSKIRNLRDFEFYKLTRKVANIVFEYATPNVGASLDMVWLEDRRGEGVNPYYNQTADGLFLEFYYGMPATLWTPWGSWGFGGSGSHSGDALKKIVLALLARFGATPHQPLRTSEMGEFGPVYALYKMDDTPLPDPIELDNAAYASYQEVTAAWQELTTRWYKSA